MRTSTRVLATLMVGVVGVGLVATPTTAAPGDADGSVRLATAAAARMQPVSRIGVNETPKLSHQGVGAVGTTIDGIQVGLNVPNAERGLRNADGAVVAAGRYTDSVVRPAPGGLQALTVIRNSAAPDSYTYTLTDASFEISGEGVVTVTRGGRTIGMVAPPWAVDAVGNKVPTHYEVHDGALVQIVNHRGATYPVVADPSISFGWYVYVRYSKSEVQQISITATQAGNMAALALTCYLLGLANPALSVVCMALGTPYIDSVINQIKDAQAAGQCIEHKYTYPPPGALVGWTRYDC